MDNNRLAMEDYLLVLKSTVEVYVHGTLESTNKDVHNLLNKSLNDTLYMQNSTYNEMTNYGWYKVENVKNDVIQKTIDKLRA